MSALCGFHSPRLRLKGLTTPRSQHLARSQSRMILAERSGGSKRGEAAPVSLAAEVIASGAEATAGIIEVADARALRAPRRKSLLAPRGSEAQRVAEVSKSAAVGVVEARVGAMVGTSHGLTAKSESRKRHHPRVSETRRPLIEVGSTMSRIESRAADVQSADIVSGMVMRVLRMAPDGHSVATGTLHAKEARKGVARIARRGAAKGAPAEAGARTQVIARTVPEDAQVVAGGEVPSVPTIVRGGAGAAVVAPRLLTEAIEPVKIIAVNQRFCKMGAVERS